MYADVLCLAVNFSVDLPQKLPDPYGKALAGVRFILCVQDQLVIANHEILAQEARRGPS